MARTTPTSRSENRHSPAWIRGRLSCAVLLTIARCAPDLRAQPETPAADAVQQGLVWLGSHQNVNGSWTAHHGHKLSAQFQADPVPVQHVGVTALCGLALLATGQRPDAGRYAGTLRRAIQFLLDQQSDFGFVSGGGTAVQSHALALLFLAELQAIHPQTSVGEALPKMARMLVRGQSPSGGWHYRLFVPSADLQVTTGVLVALRAAQRVGVHVPRVAIEKAETFVLSLRVGAQEIASRWDDYGYYMSAEGAYRYSEHERDRSSYALTAAAIACLNQKETSQSTLLNQSLDLLTTNYERTLAVQAHYFYWTSLYWGSLAHARAKAARRESFHTRVRQDLNALQDPQGAFPSHVGPGTAFSTAIALIALEAPAQRLSVLSDRD